jgi:release factor glutamine methyltransferase
MTREETLSPEQLRVFQRYREELLAHRPVQYVLGESWFAGMRFQVDERVLIPRPETEELVDWIVSSAGGPGDLLDVGTGSGCIAVSVARKRPDLAVTACDLSVGALEVAQQNSAALAAGVSFIQLDFLDRGAWRQLPPLRWVVSNPPYIVAAEGAWMARHVIDYEPHTALFVPETDALVFYRALGEFARRGLEPGGGVFAEIHEDRGAAALQLMKEYGAREVVLRKDLQGKDRMIKATW